MLLFVFHSIYSLPIQIEKFYSDVLALDSRLRSLCSRGTLKKLSPLPDNKLFKDHAPAKVDQRKVSRRSELACHQFNVNGLLVHSKSCKHTCSL